MESCLETGCNTPPEWVSSGCIYQRSQSHLLSGDSWCLNSLFSVNPQGQDWFLSGSQESQDNQRPFGPRSQSHLFQSHLWGQSPQSSSAALFHKEHGNYMWDLEEQVIGEESRSHNDFLSACQVILYNSPPELKGALVTSYHILLGQTALSPPPIPPQKTPPVEEQPTTVASPTPVPKQSPRPKRCTLHQTCGEHAYGWNQSKATLVGAPPASRGERSLPGSKHSSQAVLRHSTEILTW